MPATLLDNLTSSRTPPTSPPPFGTTATSGAPAGYPSIIPAAPLTTGQSSSSSAARRSPRSLCPSTMPEIGIAHLGRLAEEAADPGGLPRGASPTTAASTRRRAGHRQRAQRLAAGRPVQANVSSVARENSNAPPSSARRPLLPRHRPRPTATRRRRSSRTTVTELARRLPLPRRDSPGNGSSYGLFAKKPGGGFKTAIQLSPAAPEAFLGEGIAATRSRRPSQYLPGSPANGISFRGSASYCLTARSAGW